MAAVQITTANNNYVIDNSRSVVRTSGGVLYAAIIDGTDNKLEMWKSPDGSVWTEQDTDDKPSASYQYGGVGIAIDSNNVIHLIYFVSGVGWIYSTFTTSDDQWGTPTTIDTGFAYQRNRNAIAIDASDKPHAVWATQEGTKAPYYETVYYANKVGENWSAPLEIEGISNSKNCGYPDIAINGDGYPVIVYLDITDHEAMAALGNQNNATSFTLKAVDASVLDVAYTHQPSICVDSSENVWIAYVDSDGTVDIAKQSANWTDAWTIASDGDAGNAPSIVANGTDIYVFYEATDAPNADDIVYNKYTGSWLGETVLEEGTFVWAKAKWSYRNNNQGSIQIDYIFGDETVSPDIWWNKLVVGEEFETTTQTIQAKADTKVSQQQTITPKADLRASQTRTIQAKGQSHMFVELFDSNTYKDVGETTADWNLTLERIYLPQA